MKISILIVGILYFFLNNTGSATTNSVIAWGLNNHNQCDAPTGTMGANFVDIEAGNEHVFALKSNGSLAVWGKP